MVSLGRSLRSVVCALLWVLTIVSGAFGQSGDAGLAEGAPREADYYVISDVVVPEHVRPEVGGLAVMPDGRLGMATRRGELWILDHPYGAGEAPTHARLFASGLHEPLGLAYHDGAWYTTQRGELTRIRDLDGDDRADRFDRIASWPLSGNYHEYSYGPKRLPNGNWMVTLNLAWVGRGASLERWRGWMLEITEDGAVMPYAAGMRSPAGMGILADGTVLYSDNQGDWIASGMVTALERGDFAGHPSSLRWSDEPGSPLALGEDDVPSTGRRLYDMTREIPHLKAPAVWLPHALMGISTSDILPDSVGGTFGPFADQLFVGDQGHSRITRVQLESIGGVLQGAVFPFVEGFSSGVLRLAWGRPGHMFVGMTARGWPARGPKMEGVQRLSWTGKTPFEMERIEIEPTGFRVTFTEPVADDETPEFAIQRFAYQYHAQYGSPTVDVEGVGVHAVTAGPDRRTWYVVLDSMALGMVHEFKVAPLRSRSGTALLHDVAYYTINRLPAEARLPWVAQRMAEVAERLAASAGVSGGSLSATESSSTRSGRRSRRPETGGTTKPIVAINLKPLPGLQFDQTDVTVRVGQRIQLTFDNTDDMLHNVVIVAPGSADRVAAAALQLGVEGMGLDFVPDMPEVIAHTAVLAPGEQDTIRFDVPDEPGVYPFLCTFPGHATLMRGVIRVMR